MKIAVFTEIFDCGGIDTFIVNLINNWSDECDNFVVIANANYPGLKIIEDNVSRAFEVVRHKIPIYSNFMGGNFLLRGIRKMLSPIVRYLFIAYNVLAFRGLLLRANADVLIVVNGGYPGGDSCRAAAISWGLFSGKGKSIHNFHNLAQAAPWYYGLQEYLMDLVLCRLTSQFSTVSRAAANSMTIRPVIFKRHKIAYIYNGLGSKPKQVEPNRSIRDEIGIADSTPLCLMLGTYEPRKGHYFLFSAFKRVLEEIPNAHLLTCGFGFPHEVEQVRQYVREFQLESKVHLMGFRTDIGHLFAHADILVVASQAFESFGFTSLEAMAQRVPVVATDVGGIPEVVVNGEGGYCVGREDVESYARYIIMLLKDEALRREQGERGYKRFKQYFAADRMSAQYSELIRQVAMKASAASASVEI